MRIRTMGFAAMAALGVSAPASATDFIGTIELGGGWAFVDDIHDNTSLDDDNFPLLEGGARGNFMLGETFALQLDAGGLVTFGDDSAGDDFLHHAYFGAAHLNWRGDNYAVGALAHVGSSRGGNEDSAIFYNFGAEGLYNWTDFTWVTQAGYFWADDGDGNDAMTNAWWVRGVGRFYADPNTRFQAEGSFGSGSESGAPDNDVTAIGWGARADHSFGDSPLAVFVGYKGAFLESDDGSPEAVVDHTVSIGVGFRFGAVSIQTADRDGPSFDTPDIGRWTGWTANIAD